MSKNEPRKVYVIVRPTRSHTEFTAFFWNEDEAKARVEELNKKYPRGARYCVSSIMPE